MHLLIDSRTLINLSGGDACGGHTRSHPEHDGEDPCGRWYYAGDGMGEQAAARHFYIHAEHVSCFACDERSGAKMDILFPDADGVQNVIQTDMCRAHAVHTLKTE